MTAKYSGYTVYSIDEKASHIMPIAYILKIGYIVAQYNGRTSGELSVHYVVLFLYFCLFHIEKHLIL